MSTEKTEQEDLSISTLATGADEVEIPKKSKKQLKKELKSARYNAMKGERRKAEKIRRKAKRAAERAARLDPNNQANIDPNVLHAIDAVTGNAISVPRFKLDRRHPNEYLTEIFSDPKTPNIVIDLRFEEHMTSRELGSLDKQLAICYGSSCRAVKPSNLVLTGVKPDGAVEKNFKKHIGLENWLWKKHTQQVEDLFAEKKDKLVYLTAESENDLEDVNDDDIYIIGGIVDHNRLKGMTVNLAKEQGIRTARFPLQNYMTGHRVVLTIVSVYEILLAKKVMGWEDAFRAMLPLRWSWKPIQQVSHEASTIVDKDDEHTSGEEDNNTSSQSDSSKSSMNH